MSRSQTLAALPIRQLNPTSAPDEELAATHRFLTRMRAEAWPQDPPRSLQATLDSYRSFSVLSDLTFTIWQAWDGSEVVAEAFIQVGHYPDNRHLLDFTLDVRPEYRRRGLGTALLVRTVEVAQQEERRLLLTETDSMAPAGDAFAERAGFRRGLATHFNQLELAELDYSLLHRWQEQGQARAGEFELGFWEGALPEEDIEEAAALFQVMNTEPRDTLEVEDVVITPSELRQSEAYYAARKVESWVLYLRHQASGQLVGFTSVRHDPENLELVEQLGTGVLPAYRGLGLGKWLKAAMLLKVLHDKPQVKRVRTGNADSNAAMLGINRALGFTPYKARTVWQADLEAVTAYVRSRPGGVAPFWRRFAVLKVSRAETAEDLGHVRDLFWEYLQWANAMVEHEFGVTFDIKTMLEHDMDELSKFFPPPGCLLLAEYDNEIAGIVCLQKLGDDTGEIKRMYVRPAYRGKGIGRTLVEALLAEAQKTGYTRVCLDSAKFMHAAHLLYRSLGFKEILAYEGSEIPLEFQVHWIFMEKALA